MNLSIKKNNSKEKNFQNFEEKIKKSSIDFSFIQK